MKHISFEDRKEIERLSNIGHGVNKIASLLQRSPASISKEMRTGKRVIKTVSGKKEERYFAVEAQLEQEYQKALKKLKFQISDEIIKDITALQNKGLSNKEIYYELVMKYADKAPAASTVYRYIKKINKDFQVGEEFYQQGMNLFLNLSVNDSAEEMMRYFTQGAKLNNAKCLYQLGNFFHEGYSGVEKDVDKAFKYISQASRQGYSKAQARLGYFYEFGIGCKKSLELAAEMYLVSAINGSVVGMVAYADNVEHGISGLTSLPGARRWYKEAAAKGNFMAKMWLENHEEEYFESLGEHVTYSLEEYDYQHVINLGRHMTPSEVKEAIENQVISEQLSDEEINNKLEKIAKFGYTVLPLRAKNDLENQKNSNSSKPIGKWELFSKTDSSDDE